MTLKVCHVCNYAPGQSGMYGTVRDLILGERKHGVQAEMVDDQANTELYGTDEIIPVGASFGEEADIICWHHAMVQDWFNEPHRNIVVFLHGTPEYNFFTELQSDDKVLSLLIGLSNLKIPRAFVTMWERHVPYWENLLQMPVHYVPAWCNVNEFEVSPRKPDPDRIRLAMVDFWRTSREPFGILNAVDWLRKNTNKKIELDVWGMENFYNDTYKAICQWMYEDDVLSLRGRTLDKNEIYHGCDMVLSMSTEETRVVREAYACGVPVVCGRSGLDFTPYATDCIRPDLLAETINDCHESLLKDTEATRKYYREYAEREFSIETASKSVIEVFQKVVDEHGSPNAPKFATSNGVRMCKGIDATCAMIEAKLKDNEPFHYVRFGDGDFVLIAGQAGELFHKNSPELQAELREAFLISEEGYEVASVAGMVNEKHMRKGLFGRFDYDEALQGVVNSMRPGESFWNPIALSYKFTFEPEWFIRFARECVQPKKTLFIGNATACNSDLVQAMFKFDEKIELPARDSYYGLTDDIVSKIVEASRRVDLIVCAAGMATRVISKRLWLAQERHASFLDIGSLIDCLTGEGSRTWIRMAGSVRDGYEQTFLKTKTDIVILTHGQPEKTVNCFDSIRRNTENYRVLWIDNGSSEADIDAVKAAAGKLEACELIRLPENKGFSVGVNVALRKSVSEPHPADYVLLLNNDTVVTPGWLDHLRLALETNGFDAISPLTSENNPQSLDAIRPAVPDLPVLVGGTPDDRALRLWTQYGPKAFRAGNMVSFFCVLFKRPVIEQTGLLDENLFAYGEDNDYCMRLKLAGRKFGVSLGTYIHHDHSVTSNAFGEQWKEQQQAKARAYLAEKYAGATG